jgi:hypothetical protein
MSKTVRVFGAALAMLAIVGVAQAQIIPLPEPFECNATEGFEGPQVIFTPCVMPPLPTVFGTVTNNLCTPGASGCHTTGSWGFRCSIQRRSGSLFFGSAGGYAQYTFDPGVVRFGGYFGSNAPNPGENNDATMVFRDKDGNEIGRSVAATGLGDCQWHWNGWETQGALIAEVDVIGQLFGGAFIDMDDMCISYEGGEGHCQYQIKSSKGKGGCRDCPAKGETFRSEQACEDIGDCPKKVKTTIACQSGEGTCKIKGKRSSCG